MLGEVGCKAAPHRVHAHDGMMRRSSINLCRANRQQVLHLQLLSHLLAPSNIKLNATNHTAVTVGWEAPNDTDAEDVIAAYIAGVEEKHCTAEKGGVNCTIGGLLPRIPYNVCVRVCHSITVTTRVASSSFTGTQLVKSSNYTCSDAVCGNITIPMEGEICFFSCMRSMPSESGIIVCSHLTDGAEGNVERFCIPCGAQK